MKLWTRTTSLLFFAAASVYPVGALSATAEKQAGGANGKAPATEVRLLDDAGAAPAAAAQGQSVGAPQVSVSDTGTVEIHVNDASIVEVLRMLSLQSKKNIIASKEVRGTVTANLYNVTIKEALDAILRSAGYGYREKGNFIYVYSAKELAEIEKSERQAVTEVFRLHYTPAANAVNMIKPALSADGQVSFTAAAQVGIESSGTEAGGNAHASDDVIIVKDYADNIDRVRKIVKEIDRRPQQILVEATIVAARLNEDNALGIDFKVIGGVDFGGLIDAADSFEDGLGGQVLDGSLADKGIGGAGTGFARGIAGDRGLRVGLVTNNVAVFLQALEETTDTAVLANPKVLTLNKQRGEVLVGREDGYLTTTVTESTTVQTVEFLKTGTRLIFRPFIGDDGYIRMEVHPEDSDGRVVLGLPQKSTTEVTTNVLVKDGHTIVIGGLFRESSSTARSQVPGLGNLPLVGALFRTQSDSTVREEIIILLTPHIVKDDKAYADASEAELKELEKLRVGVRRGMMFFGRERLAEGCYDKAVAEMAKPTPDQKKALWHLDCATNLNPKFIEAIRMKENLTGKQVTAVDNSTIRAFVKQQVLRERAAAEPKAELVPAAQPAVSTTEDSVTTSSEPVAEATEARSTEPQPAVEPACQPAVAATETPAEPTVTAETPVVTTETPAAEPTTEGTVVEAPVTTPEASADTMTAEEESEPLLEESEPAVSQAATPPSTQPSQGGESDVVVTELPTYEEAVPATDGQDDSSK